MCSKHQIKSVVQILYMYKPHQNSIDSVSNKANSAEMTVTLEIDQNENKSRKHCVLVS